ncbi:hypothetical protein D3C76_1680140 [compost metagenome]
MKGRGRRLVRQYIVGGEDRADVAQAIGLQKGFELSPFTCIQWQACFHPVKACVQQLFKRLGLAGGVAPQRAENFQLHR